MIEPVPHLISELGAGYIEGVVNVKGRFITLIDLRKALTGEIVGELDEVIRVLARQSEPVAPAKAV
jgi:chemotaxis signal transduction protein